MADRKEEKPVTEQSREEQRAAELDEHRKQARREALRRERTEDLIRQAKAVVTGV